MNGIWTVCPYGVWWNNHLPTLPKPFAQLLFQIVPNMVQNSRRSPICLLSDEEKASKTEQVSADDEGSRDGEDSQGPIL